MAGLLDGFGAAGLELHSLMLLRHGHVVAEGWWAPYAPDGLHLLYSLSKSFTSTAVGLAVGEGLLDVDDLVTSFFPDEVPADVHPRVAMQILRHSKIAVTMEIYTHIPSDVTLGALRKLGDRLDGLEG